MPLDAPVFAATRIAPPSPAMSGLGYRDRLLAIAAFSVTMLILLLASWGHPLYSPDEGRYACASAIMADGGDWLVPTREGLPHLTKPPLTYWLQAISLRLLGHNEIAARLPSMIAAALTVSLTLLCGVSFWNRRTGVFAAMILLAMPMLVAIGMIATTDALLTFFWFGALACGMRAVRGDGDRWAALMWLSVALGLFTKGPLALVPVALLVIWLALSRQWFLLPRLRILLGLPLSLIPLATWVVLVWRLHPEAMDIWYHQIVDRATGAGDHNEPVWYYLPLFIGGLYPATAMLTLPWLNVSWSQAWAFVRSGRPVALLVIAVVLPLAMFSAMSGKLPSYLLPLCPALALCGAVTIEGWLDGTHDRVAPKDWKPAEFVIAAFCSAFGISLVLGVGMWMTDRSRMWMVVPMLVPVVAGGWMLRRWRTHLAGRPVCFALFVAVTIGGWVWLFQGLNAFREPLAARALVAHLKQLTGRDDLNILVYGFRDTTLEFYARHPVTPVQVEADLALPLLEQRGSTVVLVDGSEKDWDGFRGKFATALQQYVEEPELRTLWRDRPVHVLRPVEADASPPR